MSDGEWLTGSISGEEETMEDLLKRIEWNPQIFGGKPIIRGMRISVDMVLSLLSQGATEEEILGDYPDLEKDDIRACLAFAAERAGSETLESIKVESGT